MFKAIWREIREIRILAVVLVCAATLLVFYDALNVFAYLTTRGLSHPLLLGLAGLCLALLIADAAAPADRTASGPWLLSDRRRRRDAAVAALAALALAVLCAQVLGLLEPLQPDSHVEISEDGRSTLIYPEIDGAGEALAVAGAAIFNLAGAAILLVAIVAPACAARFGLRHVLWESWSAWRRRYLALFGVSALAVLASLPAGLLVLPAYAYWKAAEDPRYLRSAYEICIRVGPENIAPYAAAATIIVAIVLWCYSRAIARIIERPRG